MSDNEDISDSPIVTPALDPLTQQRQMQVSVELRCANCAAAMPFFDPQTRVLDMTKRTCVANPPQVVHLPNATMICMDPWVGANDRRLCFRPSQKAVIEAQHAAMEQLKLQQEKNAN